MPRFQVDEDRINQVFTNLMGNALQYTPTGGAVTVTTQKHPPELWATINDTGIGMATEHLPHLFTRFYRVDKSCSRAGDGSGIGLTIVKHLVEVHSGRVWVESKGVGQGSTFGFALLFE